MFGMQELPKAGTMKLITEGYGGSLYLPVSYLCCLFLAKDTHPMDRQRICFLDIHRGRQAL